MKKGTIIEGKVEYTEFPNKGIVFTEDEKVVVKGTIPGQSVKAVVNKGKKGKYEARLLDVVEKSTLETCVPECPYFGMCGGCSYQTLPYETQLELKSGQVKRLLDEVIEGEYVFEKPEASPKQWEYRNKMEFTFGNEYKDGPITLGLHKKGSFYDIVPVMECRIIHEDMREVLAAVLSFAVETGLDFYHKMSREGYFRHLLVRRAEKTGEILVDLITTTQSECDLNLLTEKLLECKCAGNIAGILHTVNDSAADAVIDQGTEVLYGRDFFTEELLGLSFKITPFSFFQTNSLGAEVLYSKAREYVALGGGLENGDKVVYDLYSGTGTIGQLLASVSGKVFGIEIVEEAVRAARENAKANGLTNCRFVAGDVFDKLDEAEEKPDFIVLDPPREGIMPKALAKILSYGVECMVYISCKPSSLANDLKVIQAAGYKVERVCCVDLFSETVHVETVCLLSRKEK